MASFLRKAISMEAFDETSSDKIEDDLINHIEECGNQISGDNPDITLIKSVPGIELGVVAEENLRENWDLSSQNAVLGMKHVYYFFTEAFRSIETLYHRYNQMMDDAENIYHQKKSVLKDETATIRLRHLWYFFHNQNLKETALFSNLQKDVELSKLILKDYHGDVCIELKKLTSLLKTNKATDEKSLASLIKKIEGLKTVMELLPSGIHQGIPLLNDTTISSVGVRMIVNPVEFNGTTYGRLADLAGSRWPIEETSFKHGVKKTLASSSTIGGYVDIMTLKTIPFKPDNIQQILKDGRKYLDNVTEYLRHRHDFVSAVQEIERSLDNSGIRGFSPEAAKQVGGYIQLLCKRSEKFCLDEAKRSLMGAKYCSLLAKRLIFNGKDLTA